VGGKVAAGRSLGTADFMSNHITPFTNPRHRAESLLKGVLYSRSSRLIPDKANLASASPVTAPAVAVPARYFSAWDRCFLGPVWMYNSSRS